MKISRVGRATPLHKEVIKTNKGGQSFSNTLDMANRENTEQRLKDLLNKIEKIGAKLKVSKSITDIREYKKQIEEYLSFVMANCYTLRRDYSISRGQIYTRVEVINQKIEELTSMLLQQEKENINIIARVDEIAGLLLDIYK